jgi:predicted DNA-binding transcriptional regulator AlpA
MSKHETGQTARPADQKGETQRATAREERRVWWVTVPQPPPVGAIFVGADGAAGALGISRRMFRELRRDATFPQGRLLAGGTLRWKLRDILDWVERREAAKYTKIGGRRPGAFGRGEHAA